MAKAEGDDWELVALMSFLRVICVALLASVLAATAHSGGGHGAGLAWFPPLDPVGLGETALVTEKADGALAEFEREGNDEQQDLRTVLTALAHHLLTIYTSKELVGVYRAIVTEARRFPELARSIYESGPGRASRELMKVLDAALARGEIRKIDTGTAADQFVGMMRDNRHLQIVLGLRFPPDDREIRQRAKAAVELFLAGIASHSVRRKNTTVKSLAQSSAPPHRIARRRKSN